MKRTLSLVVGVSVMLTVLSAVPQVSADARQGEESEYAQADMFLVGFDEKVAEENGYAIIEFADGAQASVPQDLVSETLTVSDAEAIGAAVLRSPNTTNLTDLLSTPVIVQANSEWIGGNCGASWIYLDGFAGWYRVNTGFTIWSDWAPAVLFDWDVVVSGPSWAYSSFGGGLWFKRSWTTTWTRSASPGWYTGEVLSGWALLSDGSICASGGPSSTDRVS